MRSFDPRPWQSECSELALKTFEQRHLVFTGCVSVGAGKTTLGAWLAAQMLRLRWIKRIIVVAPDDTIKRGWVRTFIELFGITIREMDGNSNIELRIPDDEQGYATTYASIHANPMAHRKRCGEVSTFVLLDELHHLGLHAEGATQWAKKCVEAFEGAAKHVLVLTGTPRDGERMPFVAYKEEEDGTLIPCLTPPHGYTYSYGQAVADKIVRRTEFRFIDVDGHVTVIDKENEDIVFKGAASISERKSPARNALERSALGIDGMVGEEDDGKAADHILERGIYELGNIKRSHPRAAGLIVCSRKVQARSIKKLLEYRGQTACIIYGEPGHDDRKIIERFAQREHGKENHCDWIISIQMFAEGADANRLRVCCFLTPITAELTLEQIRGRVVRIDWRRPDSPEGEEVPKDTPDPKPGECIFICLDKPEYRKYAADVEKEVRAAIKAKPADTTSKPPTPRDLDRIVENIDTRETGAIVGQLHADEEIIIPFDAFRTARPDTRMTLEDAIAFSQFRHSKAEPQQQQERSVAEKKAMLNAEIAELASRAGHIWKFRNPGSKSPWSEVQVWVTKQACGKWVEQQAMTVEQLIRKRDAFLEYIRGAAA